ncbi:MAG: RlpA-like double-psi beta-barrel domain-containing protein [Actinomycetota bacterium]
MRKSAIVLAAFLLAQAPAGAQTAGGDLDQARRERQAARAEAALARAGLAELAGRYATVQANADRAAARLIDAYLQESLLQAEVARARSLLDNRADAIYRAGPAAFMDVLLGSTDPGDFLARQKMIEGALNQGVGDATEALGALDRIAELRAEIEDHRAELARRQAELVEIRTLMEIRLAAAEQEARDAGREIRSLLAARQQLLTAATAEQRFDDLQAVGGELGKLLEYLGPEGGRGCDIPPDLEPTGQGFTGEASFYGEEFAGNPTAIGHIFNPELFTAAHRTMPLPSFLHVTYGGKCATVLVNDRGPYVDGRILDLSEGAAKYIGLPGVGIVHAEILRPA